MTTTERLAMEKELKGVCVPRLRALGFRGSFPDFYRETNGFVSLINFQFFSSGGSFCINIGFADRERENVYFEKDTEPKKLKVSQTRKRARLGASARGGDRWFSFGRTSYGEYRGPPRSPSDIAAEICQLIDADAVPWWDGQSI